MSPSLVNNQTTTTHRPRVVVLGEPKYISAQYLARFREDYNYSVLDASDRKQTQELLPECIKKDGPIDAFIIRMGTVPYEPFDADLLSALAPDCRIICSASAGYNEFDVDWMADKGMYFCNTVDAVAEATADMAMFLTLAVLRDTTRGEKSARHGTWRGGLVPTRDPTGLSLGIVGMGSIGKYLAKKAAVFNLKIIYYNRRQLSPEEESRYNATYCDSLHDLLSKSDIVSLNCPLNSQTTNLIGAAEFAAMKDGAFLINTARGAVVHEPSLIEALESGKVARAGLDVLCNEPNVNPYFLQSDRVVVQPHLGGLTDVAFEKAEKECFENVRALFETGKPNSPVRTLETKSSSVA